MFDRRRCLATLVAVGLALPLAATSAHAAEKPAQETGSGPAVVPDSPSTSRLWQAGDPGERLHIRGRVLGGDGQPLAGAELQIWQRDGTGEYREDRYRDRLLTAEDGTFQIVTVLPAQDWGAKHIHVVVSHPAHERLVTRILFKGDPYVDESVDADLAIPLEQVRAEDETILLGGVEFVLRRPGGD